jgi:hypothetical protein
VERVSCPNSIRLAQFGSLHLSDRARRSVSLSGGRCGSLVLYRRVAEGAKRIGAVILLDDVIVTVTDCTVDGKHCDENYVDGEKVTGVCCSAVDITDSWLSLARTRRSGGRSTRSTLIRRRWQNALTK